MGKRGRWGLIVAWFLLLGTGIGLIVPADGGPDEMAHQVYAYAVVSGQAPMDAKGTVEVPTYVKTDESDCWRDSEVTSALCARQIEGRDSTTMVEARSAAANYPPLYYAIVGWPLLFLSGWPALLGTRILSVLLFSLLAGTGIWKLSREGRDFPTLLLTLAVTTPSVFAIVAGVNPQALEIGASILFAGYAWNWVLYRGQNRIPWPALTFAAVLMILSRSVGMLWAIALSLVFLVAMPWPRLRQELARRGLWTYAGVCALACVAVLAWGLLFPQPLQEPEPQSIGGVGPIVHFMGNLLPEWVTQYVGVMGGAHTARMPQPFVYLYLLIPLGLLWCVLVHGKWRQRLVPILGILCAGALCLVIVITLWPRTGPMWQTRYAMPLIMPISLYVAALASKIYGRIRLAPSGTYRPDSSKVSGAISDKSALVGSELVGSEAAGATTGNSARGSVTVAGVGSSAVRGLSWQRLDAVAARFAGVVAVVCWLFFLRESAARFWQGASWSLDVLSFLYSMPWSARLGITLAVAALVAGLVLCFYLMRKSRGEFAPSTSDAETLPKSEPGTQAADTQEPGTQAADTQEVGVGARDPQETPAEP